MSFDLNHITQEAEAGRSLSVQGQPGLHNKFQAGQGYIHNEPVSKNNKTKNQASKKKTQKHVLFIFVDCLLAFHVVGQVESSFSKWLLWVGLAICMHLVPSLTGTVSWQYRVNGFLPGQLQKLILCYLFNIRLNNDYSGTRIFWNLIPYSLKLL